ncbi:MFS transporter [Candidatus Woesearchaeota archaeon]|nr:MFS transporter [Candidatus Woesearchaeota archaeon]
MKTDYERNIWKYYLFVFFKQFMIFLPIFILFYQENGLSLAQIGFLATAISITGLILELPSGVFADLYGRKLSLILGISLVFIGYSLRAFGVNFVNFLIALTIGSIGNSLISGADSAMLYDSLKELKQTHLFKKYAGTANFFSLMSMGIASFFGGLLSVYGLRMIFYISLIPIFLAFIISFTFKEPEKHKKIIKANYLTHLKEGLIFSFINKKVRFLILFSGFVVGMMILSHIFFQPYMKQIGLVTTSFGLIYFIFLVISAISSKSAHFIEEKIGQKWSITIIPLILIIQLFLMGKFSFYFGFLFIFLGEFIWGFTMPIINHYINEETSSYHRATVLSINAMSYQIIYAIFSPLIGWFADIWTLSTALMIQAGIVVLLSIFLFISWKISYPVKA